MLFIDKKKIDGDTFAEAPITLKQVKELNPNTSIPDITVRNMSHLEKVVDDIGYEVCNPLLLSEVADLVGDSFKERKLTLVNCTKESGVWKRNFKTEKLHGEELKEGRARLREKRNDLLAKSDWTQVSDAPLSQEKKSEWKVYRQALRDLPNNLDHTDLCKFHKIPTEAE